MKFCTRKSVDVRRSGASLVAAFHRAEPPLVWRYDLDRNHSFTLALQGEDGEWELGLTSLKGEFLPVARFVSREDADQAFSRLEQALARPDNGFWRVLLMIVAALLMAVVVFAGIKSVVSMFRYEPSRVSSAPATQRPAVRPEMKGGVPLPADEFLKPPSN